MGWAQNLGMISHLGCYLQNLCYQSVRSQWSFGLLDSFTAVSFHFLERVSVTEIWSRALFSLHDLT